MIRVDVETVVMSMGPVPSVIVLRERSRSDEDDAPLRSLSIQTGSVEAACISRGMESGKEKRPLTHNLTMDIAGKLGARLERIEINRVDAPLFFANAVFSQEVDGARREVAVDSRPSDAIALAVRANAPMYVEDEVMNRVGTVTLPQEKNETDEVERFDKFIEQLSPDDF